MGNQTLIAYATKAGSTGEVAQRIGKTLAGRGAAVDVKPVKEVKDLSAYSTVILGSAIRMGNVLPEVKKFVEAHQAELQQKNFSAFFVCMTLKEDTEENRKTVNAYLDPVRALVQPASEGMFAGVLNAKKIGLLERLMMNMMKASEGDFRRWDQIETWAQGVPVM